MTNPDQSTTTYVYKGASEIRRKVKVWDGAKESDAETIERYDGRGRLWEVVEPTKAKTKYSYDYADRLITVVQRLDASAIQRRYFRYDGRGFMFSETHPESGTTSYLYDAKGNVVTTMKAGRATVHSLYDAAGRLQDVSTAQAVLQDFDYGQDLAEKGRLVKAVSSNHRLTGGVCTKFDVQQEFAHEDGRGRVTRVTTSLRENATDRERWEQSYEYDDAGLLSAINYPNCMVNCGADSRRVTFTNGFGRPRDIKNNNSSVLLSLINYAPNGMVATIHHSNGVLFTQTPDSTGMPRPASISSKKGAVTLWSENYSYDSAGNVMQVIIGQNEHAQPATNKFAYDMLSRLVRAEIPNAWPEQRQDYTYDRFGNLTKIRYFKSDGTELPALVLTTDSRTNRLAPSLASYSERGNLAALYGKVYDWDKLDRLRSVTPSAPAEEAWVHTYDTSGERVWSWRTTGTRLDKFSLRGLDGKILREYTKDSSGVMTRQDYIYREGSHLATVKPDGTLLHFDGDYLGSVRVATDASGTKTAQHNLWPYGAEYSSSGVYGVVADAEQMKFTGHERDLGVLSDPVDDLDYMHARHYAPLTARMLSVDPVLQTGRAMKQPQLWNRYSYGLGNPLKFVDPTGSVAAMAGGKQGDQDCEGLFGCIRDWFLNLLHQNAPPPQENPADLAAQGYTDPDVSGTAAINPVQQAGQVQASFNETTANVGAAVVTAAIVIGSNAAGNVAINKLDDIFLNPRVLSELAPSRSLIRAAKEAGWEVGRLGKGEHSGQGLALREIVNGNLTGRQILWHPGGGHHGPLPYWKVSSGIGGVVRVGPQF